ncbi:hypothetical protein Y032_0015g2866 [Ancylostoma ceylanicum]|uniref:Uncharacterized protein n=1 Tax=Ancylostoma ceylanicum TaxID=53326 RepID=A0A016V8S1_9BILA|nr:hypothetical protein Y032_0015g2866 [Ancylostoma ceylanicum]
MEVVAYLPCGPCRIFGAQICSYSYIMYNVLQVNMGFAVALAMHYRYALIYHNEITRRKLIRNIVLSYVPPILMCWAAEWFRSSRRRLAPTEEIPAVLVPYSHDQQRLFEDGGSLVKQPDNDLIELGFGSSFSGK